MKIGWRVWRSHRAQLRKFKCSELGTTTEVKRVYVAAALCDLAYSVVGDPTYGAKVQPSQVAAAGGDRLEGCIGDAACTQVEPVHARAMARDQCDGPVADASAAKELEGVQLRTANRNLGDGRIGARVVTRAQVEGGELRTRLGQG